MGMSLDEVAKLLGMVAAFDGRTSGQAEIHAWNEINLRGNWTYDEAREQVVKFFERDQPGWLMPGKLNEMIRSYRRDQMDRVSPTSAAVAVLDGTPYPVGDDPHWGARNSAELEEIHATCAPFMCDFCRQPIGKRCMNRITGNAAKIPHLARLKAAGVSRDYP